MVVGELVRRGSRTPRDRSIVHCVINVGEMGRLVRRGGFEGTVDFEVGAALASQWPIHRVDSRVTSSLLLQSNEHQMLRVAPDAQHVLVCMSRRPWQLWSVWVASAQPRALHLVEDRLASCLLI